MLYTTSTYWRIWEPTLKAVCSTISDCQGTNFYRTFMLSNRATNQLLIIIQCTQPMYCNRSGVWSIAPLLVIQSKFDRWKVLQGWARCNDFEAIISQSFELELQYLRQKLTSKDFELLELNALFRTLAEQINKDEILALLLAAAIHDFDHPGRVWQLLLFEFLIPLTYGFDFERKLPNPARLYK